ncbi:hypothetical protein M8J76_011840 [Diaphorina citri]|nr:hypothetical protein M8J76_011840 [Diaphorina citri]
MTRSLFVSSVFVVCLRVWNCGAYIEDYGLLAVSDSPKISPAMDAIKALNDLMAVYRKNITLHNATIVDHLKKFDAKLSLLEIKSNNLWQMKVELRKDMDWWIHQFIMPAQADYDVASVDIFNIPDEFHEDALNIVMNIGNQIGYPVSPKMIRDIYSETLRRKNTNEFPWSKTLVVRFRKVTYKWEFLRAYRKFITILINAGSAERRKIPKRHNHIQVQHVVSHVGMRDKTPNERYRYIFLDDHIGPFVRRLYRQVSKHCEAHSIPYLWVNNSKIYVRKKKSDPAIRIKKLSHMHMIKSLFKKYTKHRED